MSGHVYEISGVNIVSEIFEEEVVAVNLDSGKYYSMRGCSAYIWNALMVPHSVEQIVEVLSKHYHRDAPSIMQDMMKIIKQLQEEGLIRVSQKEVISPLKAEILQGEYSPPEINIFSDMQEILLLDPVHDVDEMGWPIPEDKKETVSS